MFHHRIGSVTNIALEAKSWLTSIRERHPNFEYNFAEVSAAIEQLMCGENKFAKEIFPGVFASPIGNTAASDTKLVPLKLIKVTPGAIIPLHRHGGLEYLFLDAAQISNPIQRAFVDELRGKLYNTLQAK